jgi:hypothetical protein
VARKGWPEALKDVHVTADVINQWISYQPSSARACVATVIETQEQKAHQGAKSGELFAGN